MCRSWKRALPPAPCFPTSNKRPPGRRVSTSLRVALHRRSAFARSRTPSPHRATHTTETIMSDKKENEVVRIDLTAEQKEQVKAATEKNADAIELTVQELEARIAPLHL